MTCPYRKKMTNEEAIDIFQRMRSFYQGDLITDFDKRMQQALDLAIKALETGEVYMTGEDYNLYIEGYKAGKRDFAPKQGKWLSRGNGTSINYGRSCSLCGKVVEFSENYCPGCGAKMKGGAE